MRRQAPGFMILGATAVVAGCGGGGSQNASSAGHFMPPAAPTYAMSSATLTVKIPARGAQSTRRKPKWVSPGSATLGVRVLPVPVPNPTPTEQVFALPTPGPVPTSTTLQVAAPVSSDTFIVTAYDGGGHALATGSSASTPIAPNTANNVSVSMLGVASGVVFSVNGSSTPTAWRVLTNLGADQSATLNAAPVDAQNNLIPGTLAAPASINGTGGVQLSASSIATATTVTATYPHGTNTQGSVTSPLALNAGASTLNVGANADSYIFALNSDYSTQVIDVLTRTQVGSTLAAGYDVTQNAALSGCSAGAFAIEGSGQNAYMVSVPAPTVANPTPAPVVAMLPTAVVPAPGIAGGLVGDNACNLFYNMNDGSGSLAKLSGFDSGPLAPAVVVGTGMTTYTSLYFVAGQISVWLFNGGSYASTLSISATSGGAATSSAPYSYPSDVVDVGGLVHSSSPVYIISNLCTGQPEMQSLSGGPSIMLSEFAAGGGTFVVGVAGAAQASDGTMYLGGISAAGSQNILAYGAVSTIGNAGTPTVPLGGVASDVRITPDQQFVCVLEKVGSGGQIEFFQRNPTPALVGTVALSPTSTPVAFSIGP